MLDRLPTELRDLIAKYSRIESLKALCLVARRFRRVSQNNLFSTLEFSSWSHSAEWEPSKPFYDFITSSPHLCDAVRVLKVNLAIFRAADSHEKWDTILPLLINLRGISFERPSRDFLYRLPPPLPTILRSSSVHFIHLEEVDLTFSIFSGCPNLKHLRLCHLQGVNYQPTSESHAFTHRPMLETLHLDLEIEVLKVIAKLLCNRSCSIDISQIRDILLDTAFEVDAKGPSFYDYAPHWKLLQYCARSLRRVYFSPPFIVTQSKFKLCLDPINFLILQELEEFIFEMIFDCREEGHHAVEGDTAGGIAAALEKMSPLNQIHTITIYTRFSEFPSSKKPVDFNLSEWKHLDSVLCSSRFPLLRTVKIKGNSRLEKYLSMVIPDIRRMAPYLHGSGILQWEMTDMNFSDLRLGTCLP